MNLYKVSYETGGYHLSSEGSAIRTVLAKDAEEAIELFKDDNGGKKDNLRIKEVLLVHEHIEHAIGYKFSASDLTLNQ